MNIFSMTGDAAARTFRARRPTITKAKIGVETLERRSMLATMGGGPLTLVPPADSMPRESGAVGISPVSVLVVALPATGFNYTRTSTSITITGYMGSSRDVVIPDSLAGLPVTGIAAQAFRGSSIQTLSIPRGVRVIGADAFKDCNRLTTISVAQGNPSYLSMNGVLYTRGPQGFDTLVICPRAKTSGVVIPTGVRAIGADAFNGSAVSVVTVPSTVNTIGVRAFNGARNLQWLSFQGNAPSLQSDAFTGANKQAVIYFQIGTKGWGTSLGGLKTIGQRPCGGGVTLGPGR